MTIRFVAWLLLLVGIGCAPQKVLVRVDSYSSAAGIPRAAPVCFQEKADGTLSNQARHRELVAVCSSAARDVGINIVPEGTPACSSAHLSWRTTKGTVYNEGSTCFGEALCTNSNATYYGKIVGIGVIVSGTTVFESRADLSTQNPDFTDTTAYVTCRAIFEEYPNRVANKRYSVAAPKK